MGAQIVEIAGEKMAMLPVADYERLLDLAEDRIDAEAAARAQQRRTDGEEYLPAEFVDRMLAGESPLRLWRQYRKLTLKQLAALAGVGLSFLSEIERGLKRGSIQAWGRLARALNVDLEDLLPIKD